MTAPVILSAGVVVDFVPPGSANTYKLAAPSFGQAGRLVAFMADRLRPGQALFNEAIRDGVRALAGDRAAGLVELVDAFEEADDNLQATYAAHGRDDVAAVKGATLSLLRAERGRAKAEAVAWDFPALVALRQARADADRAEALLLAREALRGWSGDMLPAFGLAADGLVETALVEALPAHEVAAIARKVGDLTRPSGTAEKN